jgi:hypothetical protein
MNSSQFDDINDEAKHTRIARLLGISYEEVQETNYEIDTNESNDGLIYNYIIRLSENTPEHILQKIPRIKNYEVIIDPWEMDQD